MKPRIIYLSKLEMSILGTSINDKHRDDIKIDYGATTHILHDRISIVCRGKELVRFEQKENKK